jgi:hypothetical protein
MTEFNKFGGPDFPGWNPLTSWIRQLEGFDGPALGRLANRRSAFRPSSFASKSCRFGNLHQWMRQLGALGHGPAGVS